MKLELLIFFNSIKIHLTLPEILHIADRHFFSEFILECFKHLFCFRLTELGHIFRFLLPYFTHFIFDLLVDLLFAIQSNSFYRGQKSRNFLLILLWYLVIHNDIISIWDVILFTLIFKNTVKIFDLIDLQKRLSKMDFTVFKIFDEFNFILTVLRGSCHI